VKKIASRYKTTNSKMERAAAAAMNAVATLGGQVRFRNQRRLRKRNQFACTRIAESTCGLNVAGRPKTSVAI
jgi:hypothetical protein